MFPLTFFSQISRKTALAAIVIPIVGFLVGIFFYEVYTQPLLNAHAASVAGSPGTVYLSPSAVPAVVAPAGKSPMLEVHIANNGLTLLRGARVVSVSGSSIRVDMSWSADTFIWNVDTGYNTQFFGINGAKETLADIQPGDIVTVTGDLNSGGVAPGVSATVVHE